MKNIAIVFISIIALQSCSIFKKNDPEKNVRTFLKQFEDNLQKSDEIILSQFQVDKSREAILKAMRIMQNKDGKIDSVRSAINFSGASVTFEGNDIRVLIGGKYISLDDSDPREQHAEFVMLLKPDNDSFKIMQFDADNFYYDYKSMVREIKEKKEIEREIASKKIYFDQARKLSQTYDSVIWVTRYQDSIYYYVVNGKWKNYFLDEKETKPDSVKMGLVSETGRVIVPPDYSLIGTIAFDKPDVVEVKKNGHVGLYSMDGRELVPAIYDWIIPYDKHDIAGFVKQDSIYGWLDNSYAYHAGFPNKFSEDYVMEYKYLSNALVVDGHSKTFTEILDIENMGVGIVMPSLYLVASGVLDEIIPRVYRDVTSLAWGGTNYIQVRESFFKRISDNVSALIVRLRNSYTEGREEFYEENKVNFISSNSMRRESFEISDSLTAINIKDTLLEVRMVRTPSAYNLSFHHGENEWNPPIYHYFSIVNKIEKMESKRVFQFSEFIKMDSTYLTGEFAYWDPKAEQHMTRFFLSNETIKNIRNELLATNGYIFADEKISKEFEYRNWYRPQYGRYKDVIDQMSEIDKHNLQFLETIVGTLNAEGVTL
jgi:hypothetical protein